MKTQLLHIACAEGNRTVLGPVDLEGFAWRLGQMLELAKATPISVVLQTGPFEATFELSPLRVPEGPDALQAVIAAFSEIDVTSGHVDVALSEHTNDDPDFEAPPWFEETLKLGAPQAAAGATFSMELHSGYTEERWGEDPLPQEKVIGGPLSPAQFQRLEAALRRRIQAPIEFVVMMSPTYPDNAAVRINLQPMPVENLPTADSMKAIAAAVSSDADVVLVKLRLGAYVGTWDRTLFQEEVTYDAV